jgi:hypothetical protein
MLIAIVLASSSQHAAAQTQQCVGGTCAQVATPLRLGAQIPDPIGASLSFDNWMGVVGDVLDSVQAKQTFKAIAWAVFGIAIFFTSMQLVKAGGIFEGFEYVVIRVFIAGAVIIGSDALGDVWKDTWHWGYKTSTANMRLVYAESAQQLAGVATKWPTTMIKMQVMGSGGEGQSSASVRVDGLSANPVMDFFLRVLVPLSGLMYACLSGFYTFSVLASVFTIIFGKIVLPLIGALLAFPGGSGLAGFGTWARAMTSAAFAGFFLPLIFGIAAFIAILIPLSHMQVAMDLVDQMTNAARAASMSVAPDAATPGLAQAAMDRLADVWGWNDLKNNLVRLIAAIVVLPFAMVVGMMLGGNVIMRSSGWLANLLGGVSADGGYSNPVAHTAARVWGPGAATAVAGAVGAVGGAVGGAVANAVGAGARAVGSAIGSGARAAGGAMASGARTAATAAMMGGTPRASAGLNMNRGTISSRIPGPGQQDTSRQLSATAVIENARRLNSEAGKFNPGYLGAQHTGPR